jgi:hypothetical protein
MAIDGWIMVGIMVFVIVAQGFLWAWVFVQRRRVAPDVKVMNLRELYDLSRKAIDDFYRRNEQNRRAR